MCGFSDYSRVAYLALCDSDFTSLGSAVRMHLLRGSGASSIFARDFCTKAGSAVDFRKECFEISSG